MPSISLEDEELYLRVREYHSLASQIDSVLQATIDEQLEELVVGIDTMFLKFLSQSHDVKNNNNHKRKRIENEATTTNTAIDPYCHSHAQYIMEASQHYSPAMLPLVKLRAPHNILDQHHLSTSLVAKLKQSKPRRAVCHVSSSLQTSNNQHCGPLLREIVRQCIEQDDFDIPLRNHTKQQHVDVLRYWTRHTKRFGELVVILQGTTTPQTVCTRVMQAFLHLLERLRREDGCAIQLIWIASSPLPPLEGNLFISTMALPPSQHLVNQLWHGLITSASLLLSPTIISCIHSCFQNQHRSFVKVVVALKQAIALQLSMPGSLAMTRGGCQDEKSRLDWLECSDIGRKALLGQNTTTNTASGDCGESSRLQLTQTREIVRNLEQTLRSGMQALQAIQEPAMPSPLLPAAASKPTCSTGTSSFCMDLIQSLAHPHLIPTMARKLTDELQVVAASDRSAFLLRIESARCALTFGHTNEAEQEAGSSQDKEKCSGNNRVASYSSLWDAVTATNEIILLVTQHYFLDKDKMDNDKTIVLHHSEQARFQEDFWHSIYEWIFGLLKMASAATLELDKLRYSISNGVSHYQYIADSLMVPHRRRVTSALMANTKRDHYPASKELADVYQLPSVLFRLIADRVAITRQDWFQLYKEWMKPEDLEEAWLLFSLGVFQLIHVGLIREKSRLGKNAQSVYEKAALVWSTGE